MSTMYETPPPPYHAVVSAVQAQLQNTSSVDVMKTIFDNLNTNDIKVLASHEPQKPTLTPEEEEKFRKGFQDAFNSDTAKRHMELTADQVAKACQAIETSFDALGAKLAKIDSTAGTEEKDKFAPKFAVHRTTYRKTLQESRAHAVEIAGYGERFDEIILPVIMDKDISKEVKLDKIKEFIKDSEKFAGWAKTTIDEFTNLKYALEQFTGTFSAWSVAKEGKLQKEVEDLTTEINELTAEIESLRKKLLISGSVAAGSLPVFGLLAVCSGPFAPIAIISGVISAGVASGFAISYAAQITGGSLSVYEDCGEADYKPDRSNRKRVKEDKRKDLNAQISDIKKARVELEQLGKQNLATYGTNIDVLNSVWNYVVADAIAIKGWLEGAGKDSNLPPKYVLTSVGNAKGLYAQMAVYLRRYADGVKPS